MTILALPRPRNALLDRLRTIQIGIAARGSVGAGLATQRGGAAAAVNWSQWFDHVWIAKSAASLAASYIDLVGSKTLTTSAAPTLGADGWTFNGSTQYLNTGVVCSQRTSFGVRFSNATKQYGVIVGEEWFWIVPKWEGNIISYRRHPTGGSAAPSISSGILFNCNDGGYQDGSLDLSWPDTGTPYGVPMYIGCKNAFDAFFATNATVQIVVIKNGPLNAAAVEAASEAMAAL